MNDGKQLVLNTQFAENIDALVAEKIEENTPGCIVAVVHNGEVIFKKGYGYANLDHMVPITDDTSFYIASLSKQFIAMSVLLLAEAGQVDLDKSIRTYLKDLPENTEAVTVNHLIHHTGGLRSYINLIKMKGFFNNLIFDNLSMDDIYSLLLRQKDVVSLPGEKYQYSNTGYILLVRLIEHISGKSFAEFTQEHIFSPLGMETALFIQNPSRIITNYAQGYKKSHDGFDIFSTRSSLAGSTGMVCTVKDMVKWDRFLSEGGLGIGKWNLSEVIREPGNLSDGTPLEYSYGLQVNEYKGRKTIYHGGSLFGSDSFYLKFIDDDLSVIIFSNLELFGCNNLAYVIADVIFNPPSDDEQQTQTVEEPKSAFEEIKFVACDTDGIVGIYRSRKSRSALIIESEDEGITLNLFGFPGEPHKYSAVAENDFILSERGKSTLLPPNRVKFVDEEGSIRVDIYYGEEVYAVYDFLRPIQDDSIVPSDIHGVYCSHELDTFYRVTLNKHKLLLRNDISELSCLQITRNEFTYGEAVFEVQRNETGEVTGLIFYSGPSDTKGLEISKIKCDIS